MKKSIIVYIICFMQTSAYAEEETIYNEKAIREGNWGFGLSGNIAYDAQRGLNYHLSSEIQYFFMDGLAAGVVTNFQKDRFFERTSLGLIGTYYFYEMQNSAFYISQSVTWNEIRSDYIAENKSFWSGTTTLGYNYFLNKNIAIGPRIQYDINPAKTWGQANSVNVGIGLSVFF